MFSIAVWYALYVFSTGRRLFTLQEIRKVAVTIGDAAVIECVDWALAHDRETRRKEAAWRQVRAKRSTARGRAAEIDNHLDRVIGGIYNSVVLLLRSLSDGSALAGKARAFLEKNFPEKAEAITHAEYEDALAMIEEINEDIAARPADELRDLNIAGYIPQLVSLTPQFRAELERTGSVMRFAELAEARRIGHERLCYLVATIHAQFRVETPENIRAREALLAPLVAQNERVRARNARRPSPDVEVNPSTGDEVDRDALDQLDREQLDRPAT